MTLLLDLFVFGYLAPYLLAFLTLFWATSCLQDHSARVADNALSCAKLCAIPIVNIAIVMIFAWVMLETAYIWVTNPR